MKNVIINQMKAFYILAVITDQLILEVNKN